MACHGCGSEKVFARALCQACYWRLRRNGTLERKNAINSGRCSASGCHERAIAKSLCSRHYQRAQHPLMAIWKLLRSRYPSQYPEEWDDFNVFLALVGERPKEGYQLRRKDAKKPWAGDNFHWLHPLHPDKKRLTTQAEYGRAWNLKRKYGVSTEEYAALMVAQDGKCAICRRNEVARDARTGRLRELAVDHCHKSGKKRGLLCSQCNKGVGHFDDDIDRLRAAIAYLETH